MGAHQRTMPIQWFYVISSLRAADHADKPYPYNLQYHFHSIEKPRRGSFTVGFKTLFLRRKQDQGKP